MTFKSLPRFSLLLTITVLFQTLPALAQPEPTLAWAKRIGNNSTPSIYSPVVTVDQHGNSYLTGSITGPTFTLEGITISATHTNVSSVSYGYIAKYDPNGQIIWAKSTTNIKTTKSPQGGHGLNRHKMIVDEQGNIYLCGLYSFNTFMSSAIDDYLLTDMSVPSSVSDSQDNMFLAKLDADGNVLWVKKTTHPYNEPITLIASNEIHFDLEGNINMTGSFRDSIRFSPNNMLTTHTGDRAVFLARYSPTGEVLQAKKLEGETYPENQFGTEHVRADAAGNLYRWSNRTANNPKRLYRYDAEGTLLDSVDLNISFGVPTGYYGQRSNLNTFAVSSVGDIYIGGAYVGNITINGSTYNGSGSNNSDAVVFKLTEPNYEMDWIRFQQTTDNDGFTQLITDGLGNVYTLGTHATLAANRMMLQKYTGDGTLLWNLPLATGSDVTPTSLCLPQNGGNIWVGGLFRNGANFGPGYQWTTPNNNHYNGFLAQYGVCNTANPAVNTPPVTTLCGQKSITLSASLNNPALTYFWSTPNGTVAIAGSETTAELTVTQPGKYYLVAQEDAECYGKSQEIWITQAPLPNNTVTEQDNILTATETTQGTTYQWLDCNNNTPIAGENAVSFTPVQNGSYAVVVTSQNGCTDTSFCHSINTLSITNNPFIDKQITLYPNPTSNNISVQTDLNISEIYILDLRGKKLQTSNSKEVDLSEYSSGIYLIKVKLKNNETWTSKIIKD